MNIPRFTAETSLYRTMANYRTRGIHGSLQGAASVMPQLIRLPLEPGCGECTPLQWPDGTPTGACARACCNVVGRCWTETCSCGGGGLFGGGWGRVFAE